jgi:DNA-binding transcriptional LysR family regulator
MNLDPISLDQLRVALAVAEAGSFTAAGRRLGRAQSAVSQAVMNLEAQLGVDLFDRAGYRPRLTPAGASLMREVRAIVARSEFLRAQARAIAAGLEPELGIVLDAVWPMRAFAEILDEFRSRFPTVAIRLHVEALGGVAERVLDGTCALGVLATMPELPGGLVGRALRPVLMTPVAAPGHPLAAFDGRIPKVELHDHVQIVLSDRSRLTEGRDFWVLSPRTWRVGDLSSKRELLKAGLGWGSMPHHMVAEDIESGALRPLLVEGIPDADLLPAFAFHRADGVPGVAGRWMLARLTEAPGT